MKEDAKEQWRRSVDRTQYPNGISCNTKTMVLRYTIRHRFRSIFIDRSISDTTSKARNKLPKYISRRTKAIPTLRRTCKFAFCTFQFMFSLLYRPSMYPTISNRSTFSVSSNSGDLGRSEEKKTFCMRFDSYDRIHARPYYERVRKIRKRLILQARLKITVKRMHFGR